MAMPDCEGRSGTSRFFSEVYLRWVFLSEITNHPTVGIDSVTVAKFKSNLNDNLSVMSRKIFGRTYRFTNYLQLLVAKSADSFPRELCIPTVRDKVVLKALSQALDDVFSNCCKTRQPQLLIDEVSKCLNSCEYDSFAKLDIQRFYASIDHDRLMATLRAEINDEVMLDLIEKAIKTPSVVFGAPAKGPRACGVPEGLSISNKLANVFLAGVDSEFKNRADVAYFRYVDDILVLGKSESIASANRDIALAISELGLKLNSEKTREGSLAVDCFDYLGYSFKLQEASVGAKARRSIEAAIEWNLKRAKKQSDNHWLWRFNLRITGCKVKTKGGYKRFGWLYYYSRAHDVAYFSRLDSLVQKIARREGVNLPVGVKSFKKTYYEMKYRESKTSYIPVIDYDASAATKKRLLKQWFGISLANDEDDEKAHSLFSRLVSKEISILERDVGIIS